MLVISRRTDEEVWIDAPGCDRMIMKVVAICFDRQQGTSKVKFGFDGPREISILRPEAKKHEKKKTCQAATWQA